MVSFVGGEDGVTSSRRDQAAPEVRENRCRSCMKEIRVWNFDWWFVVPKFDAFQRIRSGNFDRVFLVSDSSAGQYTVKPIQHSGHTDVFDLAKSSCLSQRNVASSDVERERKFQIGRDEGGGVWLGDPP